MYECIAIVAFIYIYIYFSQKDTKTYILMCAFAVPIKYIPGPPKILDAAAPPGCPSSFATASRWGRTYPPPIPRRLLQLHNSGGIFWGSSTAYPLVMTNTLLLKPLHIEIADLPIFQMVMVGGFTMIYLFFRW